MGSGKQFNARNYSGELAAKDGQYPTARKMGHKVVCLLFETTGAFYHESDKYVRDICALHGNKIPYKLDDVSWTQPTLTSYFTQWISAAIQRQAAWEIVRAVHYADFNTGAHTRKKKKTKPAINPSGAPTAQAGRSYTGNTVRRPRKACYGSQSRVY